MSSGKFIVRLDSNQHEALKSRAGVLDVSLNELCTQRLYSPSVIENLPSEIQQALYLLARQYQNKIQAVLVFGSWATDKLHDSSDIDLLVVMADDQKIARSTYDLWEKHCDPRSAVEPSFVSLPKNSAKITSLWAELALSGLVIFDPTLNVQRYLNHVRQKISAGNIIRKKTHGQYYWVHMGVS